tara:strand:+ start:1359 stop:1664 length:306 start_codon:yes stop_codon:yes gene_type:complete
MTAFNEAWSVLKGLPFKTKDEGSRGKWLPGQPTRNKVGLPQIAPPQKWLPAVQDDHYSVMAQPPSRQPEPTLEDWWQNHPENPNKTVLNNNPPFGPEGGQQ